MSRVDAKSRSGPEPAVGNTTPYVTLYLNMGQLTSHPVLLNGKWTHWSPQVENLALTSPCSLLNTDLLFARLLWLQLPNHFPLDFNRFLNLCFVFHGFSLMCFTTIHTSTVNVAAVKTMVASGGCDALTSGECFRFWGVCVECSATDCIRQRAFKDWF